jgi:hypothetical protein
MNKFAKRGPPSNQRSNPRQGNQQMQGSEDFMFNRTSLLSSALQKLKGGKSSAAPKRVNEEPIPLSGEKPSKRVKVTSEVSTPTLTYTPLQKDLFNFYTINKISLKNFEAVP